MAAILEIDNSQYLNNRSTDRDEILHVHADCGCKPCEKVKICLFAKFTMADGRHIGNLQSAISPSQFITTNVQIGAANNTEG